MLNGDLESTALCSEAYSPSANLDARTLDSSILLIGMILIIVALISYW